MCVSRNFSYWKSKQRNKRATYSKQSQQLCQLELTAYALYQLVTHTHRSYLNIQKFNDFYHTSNDSIRSKKNKKKYPEDIIYNLLEKWYDFKMKLKAKWFEVVANCWSWRKNKIAFDMFASWMHKLNWSDRQLSKRKKQQHTERERESERALSTLRTRIAALYSGGEKKNKKTEYNSNGTGMEWGRWKKTPQHNYHVFSGTKYQHIYIGSVSIEMYDRCHRTKIP